MYPWCELLCNLWWWPLNLLWSWLVCKLVWNPSWFHGLPGYTGLSLLNRLLGGWFSSLIFYNWSILLHSPCSSPWARPGPMTRSHIAGKPYRSCVDKLPEHFMVELKDPLVSLTLPDESSLFQVLSTWSLEVVLSWRSLEKAHSLSVALEPLAIWNKKLEGLEFELLKKLKISW
jgi:hypothetical protein